MTVVPAGRLGRVVEIAELMQLKGDARRDRPRIERHGDRGDTLCRLRRHAGDAEDRPELIFERPCDRGLHEHGGEIVVLSRHEDA